MNWQAAVERTVVGLGYELVDCERAPRGLLRVTIDRIPGQAPQGASVDAPVEGASEAFAPGAPSAPVAAPVEAAGPRGGGEAAEPLQAGEFITVEDCERVTRQLQYVLEVEGVDYARLEVSSPGLDRPLKKPADYQRFAGQEVELTLKLPFQGRKKYRGRLLAEGEAWRLVFHDGKAEQALDFSLEEVREARLVPVLNFKGRSAGKADAGANKSVDGGRIQ